MTALNLGSVDDDVLVYIFSFLKPPEILSMRKVSILQEFAGFTLCVLFT
jgi:hypothetical protein